ncbi:MAG TPA: hypothetical protein VE978_13935 [Chitinophagales bacterium]|nr:hypothetical protein [Chitinophagales bacterium]
MKLTLLILCFSLAELATAQKNLGFNVGLIYYPCNSSKPSQRCIDSLDKFIEAFYTESESQKVVLAISIQQNSCEQNKSKIGFKRAEKIIFYLRKKFPQFKDKEIYIIQEDKMGDLKLPRMKSDEVVGIMFTTVFPIKTFE